MKKSIFCVSHSSIDDVFNVRSAHSHIIHLLIVDYFGQERREGDVENKEKLM